jgi:hypothetical protein
MFSVLFVRKIFFHPNLRGGSPEKIFLRKKFFAFPPARQHFWGKYEKNMEKYGTVVILARM